MQLTWIYKRSDQSPKTMFLRLNQKLRGRPVSVLINGMRINYTTKPTYLLVDVDETLNDFMEQLPDIIWIFIETCLDAVTQRNLPT